MSTSYKHFEDRQIYETGRIETASEQIQYWLQSEDAEVTQVVQGSRPFLQSDICNGSHISEFKGFALNWIGVFYK